MEILEYSESLLQGWVQLHNAVFAKAHNFWRVSGRDLSARVVRARGPHSEFDPSLLLFAREGSELRGFVHGCTVSAPRDRTAGATCNAIGVHPEHRRVGIGDKLLAELRARLAERGHKEPAWDTRVYNPFWGNSAGPRTSLFGTVEGIGLSITDDESWAFFQHVGASEQGQAANFSVTAERLALDYGREARANVERDGYQFGVVRGRCPVIGGRPDSRRPYARRDYFTAVALLDDDVAGVCIGFSTPELGSGRFAIFELEVAEEHRRQGLASALVFTALLEMQAEAFVSCEVTTVQAESPGAVKLYRNLGFRQVAAFRLFA